MKTREEKLLNAYEPLQATVAGDCLFTSLLGFAQILDNSENVHEIDTDLVDIYLMLSFKNGTTLQLTGQITDVELIPGRQTNIVRVNVEDRKTGTMPNSVFVFPLNEIYSVQSLDIVAHQKRLEAKFAEEDREELVAEEDLAAKDPVAVPQTHSTVTKEKTNDESK